MKTLRIEHAITDYGTWREAFDRGAPFRESAGVKQYTIRQPVDDAAYVLIDLEFESTEQAEHLLALLKENIWSIPANSPALVGHPKTAILQTVDQASL